MSLHLVQFLAVGGAIVAYAALREWLFRFLRRTSGRGWRQR